MNYKTVIKLLLAKKNFENKYLRYFNIYLLPILTTISFVYIRTFIDLYLNPTPYYTFTIVVIIHALVGGVYSGLWTAFLTAFVGNLVFMEPTGQFKFNESVYITQTLMYLVPAVIIGIFVGKVGESEKRISEMTKVLATNQEKYKKIMNNVFTIIAIVNPDGTITEINENFSSSVGSNWDKLIGTNIVDTSLWSYDKNVQTRLREAMQHVSNTNSSKYEEVIHIGNNLFMDVEINMVGIDKDKDGDVDYILINAVDISSRKLVEQETVRRDKLFSKLVESNIIGMVIGTDKGEIIETNDAFLEMIGYRKEDFERGLNWSDIMDSDSTIVVEGLGAIDDGYASPVERQLLHKKGHKVAAMVSCVTLSKKNSTSLYIVVNLSYQKEVERRKDEFINIASHELKTPMTILKGYIQILNKRLSKTSDDYTVFLRQIDHEIDKMNVLINELHDITKVEAGKLNITKEKLNIIDVINNSLIQIEPFSDSHKVVFNNKQKKIQVMADSRRIEQVLLNLLTNAIKYSPANTTIKIKVEKNDSYVTVKVVDQGKGIPRSKVKKIFTKFFQVEKSADGIEGLGLGLYISAEIIKNHNGKIGVKSEMGKGSTFYFKLPV